MLKGGKSDIFEISKFQQHPLYTPAFYLNAAIATKVFFTDIWKKYI